MFISVPKDDAYMTQLVSKFVARYEDTHNIDLSAHECLVFTSVEVEGHQIELFIADDILSSKKSSLSVKKAGKYAKKFVPELKKQFPSARNFFITIVVYDPKYRTYSQAVTGLVHVAPKYMN